MPLSKLRGEDVQATLRGCRGGAPRRRGDELSEFLGICAQDLMELCKEGLVSRYARTIKAGGLMPYMLETDNDEPKDVAKKPSVLARQNELPQHAKAIKKRRMCASGLHL